MKIGCLLIMLNHWNYFHLSPRLESVSQKPCITVVFSVWYNMVSPNILICLRERFEMQTGRLAATTGIEIAFRNSERQPNITAVVGRLY